MISALSFIIQAFAQLCLLVLLLRLWLPWFRADFRNPIAQAILRLTSLLVVPVRRIIPQIGRPDTATVIIAVAIQYLTILVLLALQKVSAGIVPMGCSCPNRAATIPLKPALPATKNEMLLKAGLTAKSSLLSFGSRSTN